MKRTEKIEIRVSHKEKQTLTSLAKDDGQSVSGLVRSLIDKYIALNSASTKKRLPKWQILGLMVFAGFVGHGLTLIPMHLHNSQKNHPEIKTQYSVHGTLNTSAFGTVLETDQRKNTPIELSVEGQIYVLSFTMHPATSTPIPTSRITNVRLCRRVEDLCQPVIERDLEYDTDAPSVLQTRGENDEYLFVVIQPTH